MVVLLAVASIPGQARPADPTIYKVVARFDPTLQNLLHIPQYALLSWLWCWALPAGRLSVRAVTSVALAISVGYGIFEELYQSTVPGRYASVGDAVMDSLGALVGVIGYGWRERRVRRRGRPAP
jgi:VanZ family protein